MFGFQFASLSLTHTPHQGERDGVDTQSLLCQASITSSTTAKSIFAQSRVGVVPSSSREREEAVPQKGVSHILSLL